MEIIVHRLQEQSIIKDFLASFGFTVLDCASWPEVEERMSPQIQLIIYSLRQKDCGIFEKLGSLRDKGYKGKILVWGLTHPCLLDRLDFAKLGAAFVPALTGARDMVMRALLVLARKDL